MDQYAGLIGSSSCVACADAYKPGGILTVYDGNWSSRVHKCVDTHKLGRWSFITITGGNNFFLTIITGYRCVKTKHLKQQATQLHTCNKKKLKQRGITSTPQTSFVDDLESFITNKVSEGHEILVNLDANEQWEDENSAIRDMALRLNLYDIAKERHPEGVLP